MSRIKGKDTALEVTFRKNLYQKGIRGYKLNSKLSGKPDVVFTKRKIAVFIDGCFWHKCRKCYKVPKSQKKYWMTKINRNAARDKEVNCNLKKQGFIVIRFWEHEIQKSIETCIKKISKILNAY